MLTNMNIINEKNVKEVMNDIGLQVSVKNMDRPVAIFDMIRNIPLTEDNIYDNNITQRCVIEANCRKFKDLEDLKDQVKIYFESTGEKADNYIWCFYDLTFPGKQITYTSFINDTNCIILREVIISDRSYYKDFDWHKNCNYTKYSMLG